MVRFPGWAVAPTSDFLDGPRQICRNFVVNIKKTIIMPVAPHVRCQKLNYKAGRPPRQIYFINCRPHVRFPGRAVASTSDFLDGLSPPCQIAWVGCRQRTDEFLGPMSDFLDGLSPPCQMSWTGCHPASDCLGRLSTTDGRVPGPDCRPLVRFPRPVVAPEPQHNGGSDYERTRPWEW